jgi:hypothetical protein
MILQRLLAKQHSAERSGFIDRAQRSFREAARPEPVLASAAKNHHEKILGLSVFQDSHM